MRFRDTSYAWCKPHRRPRAPISALDQKIKRLNIEIRKREIDAAALKTS
jgi:hypothetical protein